MKYRHAASVLAALLTLQACELPQLSDDKETVPLNPDVPESIRKEVASRMNSVFGFDDQDSVVEYGGKRVNGKRTVVYFPKGETVIDVRGRAGRLTHVARAGNYAWTLESKGTFMWGGFPLSEQGYSILRNEQAKILYKGDAWVRADHGDVEKGSVNYTVDFAQRKGSGEIRGIKGVGPAHGDKGQFVKIDSITLESAKLDLVKGLAYIRGKAKADGLEGAGYSVVVMGPNGEEIGGSLSKPWGAPAADALTRPENDVFGAFVGFKENR